MSCLREEVFLDAELLRMRPRIAERRLCRLLHDVAELAGERQAAAASHRRRFDEEDVAADRRPRQTGRDADLIALEQFVLENFRPAEKLIQIVGVNLADLLFAGRDLLGDLAADRCDLAFEIPQSGFLRVLIDDGADAFVGELDLALLQSVFFDLFRNEMPLGDLELFLLRCNRRAG